MCTVEQKLKFGEIVLFVNHSQKLFTFEKVHFLLYNCYHVWACRRPLYKIILKRVFQYHVHTFGVNFFLLVTMQDRMLSGKSLLRQLYLI